MLCHRWRANINPALVQSNVPVSPACLYTQHEVLTRTEWILASTGDSDPTFNWHWVDVGLWSPPAVSNTRPAAIPSTSALLGQCHRRWGSIGSALGQRRVCWECWQVFCTNSALRGAHTCYDCSLAVRLFCLRRVRRSWAFYNMMRCSRYATPLGVHRKLKNVQLLSRTRGGGGGLRLASQSCTVSRDVAKHVNSVVYLAAHIFSW